MRRQTTARRNSGDGAMRRFVFTLICAAVMTFATALPVAGTGLTLVTLRCSNGTNISGQVDEDTLAGLVDAVQGMALYPAGVSCTLLQTPVLVAIGASWKDTGDPSKQTSPDRIGLGYSGSCPQMGSPDGEGAYVVLKGNVTITVAR